MTRRKKLAISVVAILALAAAGLVAVRYLAPTMHGKFERLRDGMTYDECVAIMGGPNDGLSPGPEVSWCQWRGREGVIHICFMDSRADGKQRVIAKQFEPAASSGFFDRLRSWFGL
jgi:hypothetical protein